MRRRRLTTFDRVKSAAAGRRIPSQTSGGSHHRWAVAFGLTVGTPAPGLPYFSGSCTPLSPGLELPGEGADHRADPALPQEPALLAARPCVVDRAGAACRLLRTARAWEESIIARDQSSWFFDGSLFSSWCSFSQTPASFQAARRRQRRDHPRGCGEQVSSPGLSALLLCVCTAVSHFLGGLVVAGVLGVWGWAEDSDFRIAG